MTDGNRGSDGVPNSGSLRLTGEELTGSDTILEDLPFQGLMDESLRDRLGEVLREILDGGPGEHALLHIQCHMIEDPRIDWYYHRSIHPAVETKQLHQPLESHPLYDRVEPYCTEVETLLLSKDRELTAGSLRSTAAQNDTHWHGWSCPSGGESVNGDGWGRFPVPNAGTLYFVSDGLGHGPAAAEASAEVERVTRKHRDSPLDRLMDNCHEALQSTRGAAVFLGRISGDQLAYCSVGSNTGYRLRNTGSKTLLGQNGTVGFSLPGLQVHSVSLNPEDRLLFHTDGLHSLGYRSDLEPLSDQSPLTLSAAVFIAEKKLRDDSTLILHRHTQP